jgi:hypothetical protein|nr:hypothetical protein [Aeromicrobium sp.]
MFTTSTYAHLVLPELSQRLSGSLPAVDAPYPDPSPG